MVDISDKPRAPLTAARQESVVPFHLHNSFLFWFNRLNTLLQDRFNHQLEAHGLSWPQWLVVNVLSHDMASTPAHIAEHLGVDRSAVTRLLDRLEGKNWIERVHDKLDRRSVKIFLTQSGKQRVGAINQMAYEHQQQFLSDLHSSERRGLKGELQKILRSAGVDTFDLWKRVE